MAQRLMVTNRVASSDGTLTASSAAASRPVSWLLDQLRSKVWRSASGWTIEAGFNDDFDFTEATTARTCAITAGNYATGALLAAELQTRINAIPGIFNSYTVTYSTSTKKFTVARSGGVASFSIDWNSGPNAATNCGPDMGYDVSADDSGATSYESDTVCYQSRHWVKVDLGSAQAAAFAACIEHNLGTAGTITLQGHSSDAWGSPTVEEELAGDADIRADYFTEDTLRWWRLVVDGVTVDDGYVELKWWLGPHTEPSVCHAIGMTKRPQQLSEITMAVNGAHYQDERPQRWVWAVNWTEVLEADRAILHAAFYACPRGTAFFFGFDDTDATDTFYVFLNEAFIEELTTNLYFNTSVPALVEALG